nr:MAG TPA: toxin [Caudoviricetes sp.]
MIIVLISTAVTALSFLAAACAATLFLEWYEKRDR